MPTSTEQIAELIKSNTALKGYFEGVRSAIDRKVADAERRMDDAITDLAKSHASVIISYYDSSRHSLSSLAPPIDPYDPTKTQWVTLPTTGTTYYMYPSEGHLTKVHTTYCSYTWPGHYQDPQYSKDHSATRTQFVLANYQATSEQICKRLDEINQQPPTCGGWWAGARVYDTVSVQIPGLHRYSRLFVRFVNVGRDGKPAQNVLDYGGNPSVSVDRVINYQHIKR